VQQEADGRFVRLGDLMKEVKGSWRTFTWVSCQGGQAIATLQVRYDDPALNQTGLLTETIPVEANVLRLFQTAPNRRCSHTSWSVAKYRQTQLAEAKLQQGDRTGAATMQTAAKTALQMGDKGAATVLQTSTRLQRGRPNGCRSQENADCF